LTAAPVAVFVAGKTVVGGFVVVGAAVVLAGAVLATVVGGFVVAGAVAVLATVVGGLVVEDAAGVGPLITELVEGSAGRATVGRVPSDSGADLVWKLTTAARPAIVAPTTIGARLMEFAPSRQPSA